MKKMTRSLFVVLMSLVIALSPIASFAEPSDSGIEVEQTAPEEQTPTQEPEKSDATETPQKTEEPAKTAKPTEAPVYAEKLRFKNTEVEITLAQYEAGINLFKLNSIETYPKDAQTGEFVLSVREKKDGKIGSDIAAYADYDKNGDKLEGNYSDDEIAETRFEVYQAGTVYIRAALKSNESIYAEFKLIIKDTAAAPTENAEEEKDAPPEDVDEEGEEDDPSNDLPVEQLPLEDLPETDLPETDDVEPIANTLIFANGDETDTEQITLDQVSLFMTLSDDPIQLIASIAGDIDPMPEIDWESTDETVATVHGGLVTAAGMGSALVKASYTDAVGVVHTAECAVEVTDAMDIAPISALALESETHILAIGKTLNLSDKAEDATWGSDDTDVATVDTNGEVTAVATGTATITAMSDGQTVYLCEIIVASISLSTETATLYSDKSLTLTASVAPEGYDSSIEWIYDDSIEGVGIVVNQDNTLTLELAADENGVMQVAEGSELTVTAKLSDTVTASCTVEFRQSAQSVTITGNDVFVDETGALCADLYTTPDSTIQLSALVGPEKQGFNPAVIWTSSNSNIASVNADGLVTLGTSAQAGQSVTITAAVGGLSAKITVKLVDKAESIEITNLPAAGYFSANRSDKDVELTIETAVTPSTAKVALYWSSSNPEIASVDQNGVVTCHKSGSVVITVKTSRTDSTAPSATARVVVKQQVIGISLFTDPFPDFPTNGLVIAVNQTIKLGITTIPADADTGYEIISGDPSKLAVNNTTDQIKGVKTGYTTVTIYAEGGASKTLQVRVVAKGKGVTSMKLNKTSITVNTGASYTLKATSSPSKATVKVSRWYIEDTSIATINGTTGKVTGVKPGVTYAKCMGSSGIIKTCKVTVNPQKATKVTVSPKSGTLYVGEVGTIEAKLSGNIYDTENDTAIKWSSSNSKVAIVDNDGNVYAVKKGTAYITAKTTNGKTAKAKITVKNNAPAKIALVNNNTAIYAGGAYTLDSELWLNKTTYGAYKTLASLASREDLSNVNYAPPQKYSKYSNNSASMFELDTDILTANTTNVGVTWKSSNSKIAKVNATTGVITALKSGTVKIGVAAKANTKVYKFITIKVEKATDYVLTVTDSGGAAVASVALTYGATDGSNQKLLIATVSPAMTIEWSSENSRIASVDKTGVITAQGLGTTYIVVTVGGYAKMKIPVTVTREDGSSDVTYRALVIGMFQTSGKSGYLSWGKNSTTMVRNAISSGNIDGQRYDVTFVSNSTITTEAKFKSTVQNTFKDAQEGDVSIIFLHSHGGLTNAGEYKWSLTSSKYITGETIVNTINSSVDGHVLLCVASCKSGNDGAEKSIISRVRTADGKRSGGNSLSILTSTDGAGESGAWNTSDIIAYDYFSKGFSNAVGTNMTFIELASKAKEKTAACIADHKLKYGTSSSIGTNNVQSYISAKTGDVRIF